MDDTPMVNGGKQIKQLFKTGDAVMFQLRMVPNQDEPGIIAGDLRLPAERIERQARCGAIPL